MRQLIAPIHPAELVREEFLQPLGLSAEDFIQALWLEHALEPRFTQRFLAEKIAINEAMAVALAAYFATTPQFWHNLQRHYDSQIAGLGVY